MNRIDLPADRHWSTITTDDLGPVRDEGSVLCIRYGGFGDALMAAATLPALKRQGLRIAFNCTERGADMLAHDPHIDELIVQPEKWILHEPHRGRSELFEWWDRLGHFFPRTINFTGTVEDSLLISPMDRERWKLSHQARHKHCNKNYLEAQFDAAGLAFNKHAPMHFYATTDEQMWAEEVLTTIGRDKFVVLFSLTGSSLNKAYPHMDEVIGRAVEAWPDIHFVLVGEPLAQVLEIGWENHPKVWCRSGNEAWTIRRTLALAQRCDVVLGGETGVLNAVGYEPDVGKIVLLSHSSRKNLCQHWKNVITMQPEGVPCFPCHKLIYGMCEHMEYQTGACMCQFHIDPAAVLEALRRFRAWSGVRQPQQEIA
jgi:ADP-heptose:LPS heptosyltransferase